MASHLGAEPKISLELADLMVEEADRGTLHLPASLAVSMPSPGLRELCTRTDTDPDDWVEIEGPLTGVGAESWYRHADGREAYVCDDQREIAWDAAPESLTDS